MLESDPGTNRSGPNLYECPECGNREEANGSCCCSNCKTNMLNISQPRHQ